MEDDQSHACSKEGRLAACIISLVEIKELIHSKSETLEVKVSTKENKYVSVINPLSANPTKLSNTLKQFVGSLPTNFVGALDHFVGLALNGLSRFAESKLNGRKKWLMKLSKHLNRIETR